MRVKNKELIWMRGESGLTQQELADLFNVHRVTVSAWETGKLAIPHRRFSALRKLLNLDPANMPRQLKYDAKGYPITSDDWENWPDGDHEYEALCTRLYQLEGREYVDRCVERRRILAGTHLAEGELGEVRRDAEQFVAATEMV